MAEELYVDRTATRVEKYRTLLPQLRALTEGETDKTANLANVMAALKQTFDFFWVGVYSVCDQDLVLGPFQGPVACTRIRRGAGVCGYAWEKGETVLVPDVEAFPGHIACSSLSRSEIVVPVYNAQQEIVMVLDVDSDKLHDFVETDRIYLEQVAALIGQWY